MKRLLCWLTFGHWKKVRVDDNERNTTYTTSCRKCGEMLEQRQVFDKEPWRTMILTGQLIIPAWCTCNDCNRH